MQRNTTATLNKPISAIPASSHMIPAQSRQARLKPLAHAIALMVATGSILGDAHAQQAFSAAWYAQKGAVQAAAVVTGKLPNGMPAMPASSPVLQQQQANAQLQRSLANLNSAARAIALQQAQQSAARLIANGTVPDGLGVGGLDAGSLVNSWINANGPTQSTSNGKTIVDIKQTADKAILNWETFNIGKNTILQFDQQADWSVLNRINNTTAPSVIQGQIKAPGTVMIVNANGIVFTGSSQVNTRNLVAAAVGMTNDQFNKGIYSEKLGNNDIPTFGNAVNAATGVAGVANAFGVVVEQGALIETHQTTSATQGGGYVLMVGGQVSNAGTINTANGQTTLAAGDTFVIKKGVGTAGNQTSTTRGNEVTAGLNAGSSNGKVVNTGIVTASTGDITMTGHQIEQRGVLVSSTSVDTRGTIHLQGNPNDATASITLGKDSVTAIVLDASALTALDSQKNGLAAPVTDISGNIVPANDRRDLSRIEISGGTVDFEGDSLTLATGGQVMVDAKSRALMRDGAQIDVSGAVGVQLGMDSNNLKINVQGNEQRDASVNRDGKGLNNSDIWIDKRDLILVKADYDAVKNPNGYKTDRWYTAGGLLEVAGYLATSGHTVGEWMAQGGIVNFTGNSVVTQAGSNINLSGGTLDVQTGLIKQTFLKGADGKLYNASTAPGDMLYTGVFKGYEDTSERWGDKATKYYYNPFIAPRTRLENGYTVGRDAGTLVIGTANAVLEGKISSDVFQGERQTRAPQANLDGYYQSQNAAAQHAQLIVGSVSNFYDKTTGLLSRRVDAGGIKNVVFSDTENAIADGLDLSTVLPADRVNTLVFNTEQLNSFALGSIKIAATDKIDVNGDLKVNSAGNITLYSNNVNVYANLTAHSGTIQLGNVLDQITTNGVVGGVVSPGNLNGQVTVAQGVKLDASGLWNNQQLDPNNTASLPYVNGGSVSIRSSQNATLNTGSSIDVSSGAALFSKGKTQDGKGGNVTLEANAFGGSNGVLALNGTLEGYGVAGGGTLTLQTNQILITDGSNTAAPDTLVLDGGFFNKGFSNYNLIGNKGVTVAEGTQVDVAMPVYRYAQNAIGSVTGSSIKDALELWTPPVYQDDIAKGTLTQRKGASIKLQAGSTLSSAADMAIAQAVIGKGAVVNVDPGQSITVASVGQLTVDGRLNAWGGKITLAGINPGLAAEAVEAAGHTRSIWVGEQAILDVAARAVTGVDARGNRYGQVRNGGSIVIGGEINHTIGNATAPNLFVVVRDGAVLDASGTQATLDIAGLGATNVASGGGSISLTSNMGLYLDGMMKAEAGGAGAAGGTLSVALEAPYYLKTAASNVLNPRELVISQHKGTSALQGVQDAVQAGSILTYGYGGLAVDQVEAGGFDNLSVLVSGALTWAGDVTLKTDQSLRLYGGYALADGAPTTSKVRLESSYIHLASNKVAFRDQYVNPRSANAAARGIGAEFSAAADLIDIRGAVALNAERVELTSRGDLRFLTISDGWDGINPTTSLTSPGDIVLKAAQLYPETGGGASVKAGYRAIVGNVLGYDPRYSLTIGRTTDYLPAMPYSAFGTLQLLAAHVEQGGIVRAPLGYIALGVAGYDNDITLNVNLLANSLTSVSGAGMIMPYGGTVDGQSWTYDGKAVTFTGVGGANSGGTLKVGVKLAGTQVAVHEGATLDLSGGGDLTGAGFISGRGGSTDARYNPLVQIGVNGGFSLPGLATNPIYAIVPGAQGYAPTNAQGAVDPVIGRQVTIGAGVPGLPAGTYTLMPSTYALLPGAFRVEINGAAGMGGFNATQAMRNGSWAVSGALSIAGTDIRDNLASQLIITPGSVLRSYSQYNETSYTAFALADAARRGIPRPILPLDAKTLQLDFRAGAGADAFSFKGDGRFNAAEGGYGGTVSVIMGSGSDELKKIEIVAAGAQATAGFDGITLRDDSLNNIGASRMVIGGITSVEYGQSGNYVDFRNMAREVHLRSGAQLAAPEVFLTATDPSNAALGNGLINVEQGASINTLGRGKVAYDSNDGFVYKMSGHMLAASNGLLNVTQGASTATRGAITIGACDTGTCTGSTTLYSEGTVLASTQGSFILDDAVRYGTRNLTLAVGAINIGSEQVLADAQANGIRSSGLALNQSVLDRLLRGDTSTGAPALETLVLNAANSVNFYGDVTLDTYDSTGKSTLDRLVLTTPAIYGQGDDNAVATIRTANLIWGGAETAAGNVIANGAGTGSGTLNLITERMEFGFAPFTQPGTIKSYDRLALGFANVNLSASERVTANHKGSLSVYQAQGAYESGKGFQYSGGNLNISTPLLTGAAGSVNNITAGGNINVVAPTTTTAVDSKVANDALGAELSLHGNNVSVASKVVLPSGKLKLIADEDLILTDAAHIDLAGRKIVFHDLDKYSWGGDVILESRNGDIVQAAGSTIDLSAAYNKAGSLTAVALADAAGMVNLQGRVLGSSSGYYDAGGTLVPYVAGSIEVRAQTLGSSGTLDSQFAALNTRLTAGGVFGSRNFQLKQGDLTIGNELKAGVINVSVDNGSLTVVGTIDASGERVGNIRLAGKNGLTIGSNAVLDAHSTVLRVDSYGKIIDSPNRANVELSSGNGTLTLASGAQIDLRHGTNAPVGNGKGQHDGTTRGTLTLNAPRIGSNGAHDDADAAVHGDIAIDASGSLNIRGAKSIAVNGMQRYDNAQLATVKDANGNEVLGQDGKPVLDLAANGRTYQVINQDYLDDLHDDSTTFMEKALLNTNLINTKLAGLNNATYADALHLRPGVEIVSNAVTNPGGDMIVQGDLDLSKYRYESLNHKPQVGVYGSGEVGMLTIRAAGNLDIFGSINDGFAPPPETQDDKGWVLLPGRDFTGGDLVVPGLGVTLADGTAFPGGTTLNYDLPIKGFTYTGRLPVDATLSQSLTLPAGTVLAAAVRDAAGNVLFAAGTMLSQALTLQAGYKMDAGSVLASDTKFAAVVWPKGLALPGVLGERATLILNGDKALAVGSLIPSGTDVKLLAGVTSIQLRPEIAGKSNKLWAVAQMLPEGSQSWSLRLVAGADTEAADSRVVSSRPANGSLRLADSHYGMFGKALPSKDVFVWTQAAIDILIGADLGPLPVVGEEMTDESVTIATGGVYTSFAQMCSDDPSMCLKKESYKWSQEAADELGTPALAGQLMTIEFVQNEVGYNTIAEMCADLPYWCISTSKAEYENIAGSTRFSVIRTGTGDLELLSAGNIRMDSLFGVYTAGTSSAATYANDPYNQPRGRAAIGTVLNDPDGAREHLVDGGSSSIYRAWYPDQGGNLFIKAGGDLTGSQLTAAAATVTRPNPKDGGYNTADTGNWLWRQGSGNVATGTQAQPTAWWINFGTYTSTAGSADQMVGFTGFGALGGGNVDVQVAGSAGALTKYSAPAFDSTINPRSQGIVLAVGSTGRVAADGSMQLTGGGDLNVKVGGQLNPASEVLSGTLNGALVNLRGHIDLTSAQVGTLGLIYGFNATEHVPKESRAFDSFHATRAEALGGLALVPGDATISINTRGDQVIQEVIDPGRITIRNFSPFKNSAGVDGRGLSWFTLWTDRTSLDMFSAGGNLTPYTQGATAGGSISDDAIIYPAITRAVAASGNLFYGKGSKTRFSDLGYYEPILLAPSLNGQLQFLAAESIYAGGFAISQSGAAASALATPQNPAYAGWIAGTWPDLPVATNTSVMANPVVGGYFPLFAFGANSAATRVEGTSEPARFYAMTGDLIGVDSGRLLTYTDRDHRALPAWRYGQTWYEGAQPVWMIAGRDIVSSGSYQGPPQAGNRTYTTYGNLFVHHNASDVSVVSAGRDILYSSFNVAGPGTLEITAGRNILMEDKGAVTSIGAIVPGDTRPGANVVLQAGVGKGLDYLGFIQPYLDAANLAQSGIPLAGQGGKVAKVYEAELIQWLSELYGFTGDAAAARAYYLALPEPQQRVFARNVYFAELREGGREYNDVNSSRYGSFLRSRNAIAGLIPTLDADGKAIVYDGDIIMYRGTYSFTDPGNGTTVSSPRSGFVHTNFGGNIQMLTPGGQQVFGIEGEAPPSTSGVITQGSGDIQLYARDSILLGQSRIMTTFGGDILAWSDRGDINAGRGSKTTLVYTPPKREYDQWGNVKLASNVPSTGAGIATLAPIPEVPAGDMDLLAPLGTIDAGEAGIRVSGNVNIFALQVVNAANIKVAGDAKGIPMIAAVNVGALTNASAAASSAAAAAQDVVQRDRNAARQNLPSIFTVRVLGFGNEDSHDEGSKAKAQGAAYNPQGVVQVLGAGDLSEAEMQPLTQNERRGLKK
ncbi:MAG: filamentous hemagglutinin family protein [Burkholderiaceae bacterium]|nr:filamentous hemagglutinin family protein [Burkholderiaceae bacterium]